ncbi:MAG: tetratricopeptide repeat protein [Mariprofundaceae bacterium]
MSPLPFVKPMRKYLWLGVLITLVQPALLLAKTPFELAQKLYEQGNETEAKRALQHELRLRPHNLDARYNLARLLEKAGHEREAERLYRENIDRGSHLASMINLAMILKEHGNNDEALKTIHKATKRYRHDALPWYLLAELHLQSKQLNLAEKAFIKALRADPLNGFAHLRYARFLSQYRQKKSKLAEKHGKRAVSLLPMCSSCWQLYGDILKSANKPVAARIAMQKGRALNQGYAE